MTGFLTLRRRFRSFGALLILTTVAGSPARAQNVKDSPSREQILLIRNERTATTASRPQRALTSKEIASLLAAENKTIENERKGGRACVESTTTQVRDWVKENAPAYAKAMSDVQYIAFARARKIQRVVGIGFHPARDEQREFFSSWVIDLCRCSRSFGGVGYYVPPVKFIDSIDERTDALSGLAAIFPNDKRFSSRYDCKIPAHIIDSFLLRDLRDKSFLGIEFQQANTPGPDKNIVEFTLEDSPARRAGLDPDQA